MTYRQMMERIAALRGRRPWILEVPVLTPRLSSLWLHLVTPVGASVARPLIEGLKKLKDCPLNNFYVDSPKPVKPSTDPTDG
jgi:hypothetical protein